MRNLMLNVTRFFSGVNTLKGGTTDQTLQGAANAFKGVVQKILGPVLTVIGVAAVLYAVYLGVLYAKAESADKRKEVQGRLIGACIGAVIIVAGATLCFALDWNAIYTSFGAA